jgi:acetyl-CoA synthetase
MRIVVLKVPMSDYVWQPGPDAIERANVTRLARAHGIDDYAALNRRSREDVEWFWEAVIADLNIEFSAPYTKVLDTPRGIQWPIWFVGGRVNIAHNCVHRHSGTALVFEGEDGTQRAMTYAQLGAEVKRVAAGLRELGVRKGDAVGIFLPMTPEAVVAFMAVCHIGAIVVPVFSGFAAPAVAVRLNDAQAKVLVCADGFYRRGSVVPMKETADEAAAQAPSVEYVVVVRRTGRALAMEQPRDLFWDELAGSDDHVEETESEDPMMIAYTSGTTGRPKGAVHVHGGFLVKIASEVAYQTDYRPGETLFWFSDPGWIMGPWMIVGTLALGGTIFLYDGAPNFPEPDRLWDIVERRRINILGVSPTLIRALAPLGDEHVTRHDLSSLRVLGSTGEPWNTEPYLWFSRVVGGGRCPVINFSGGTEVGACFLSPAVVQPLKACSLGGPALGMAVDVFSSEGTPIRGAVGELVCTKPWPGMTRGIWGDPDRYVDTYWSRWPDVWVHGDWATIDEDGEWYLHGRSDDTLNVAGKRIGPAEIESVLVEHAAVVEAAVVGVPDEVKGEAIWCYCVLGADAAGDDATRKAISDHVAARLGGPFRPGAVRFVSELPKTRNAKVLRRAVRAAALGEQQGDLSNLENPSALEEIASAR